ncbi:response regulator [Elusimicrobiota bacterium]
MKNILVIDDEKAVLKVCNRILTAKGYGVFLAENLKIAREVLKKQNIDLVITDSKLIGESGEELIEEVKEKYPHTAVIMMTGYLNVTDANPLTDITDNYIHKPFEMDELLEVIKKALS